MSSSTPCCVPSASPWNELAELHLHSPRHHHSIVPRAHRAEIRVGRGGKAHFDFLEPHVDEHLEQALLRLAIQRVCLLRLGAQKEERKRENPRGRAGCEGRRVVLEANHARTLTHSYRGRRGTHARQRHESGRNRETSNNTAAETGSQ